MAHAAGSLEPAQRSSAFPLLGTIPRDGTDVVVVIGRGTAADQGKSHRHQGNKKNDPRHLHRLNCRSGLMYHKIARLGWAFHKIWHDLGDTGVGRNGDDLYFGDEFGVTVH